MASFDMRVKISSDELRSGFPFKRSLVEVSVTVDFTHEEKQIIKQRELGEHILIERWPADARGDDEAEWYALRVKHLLERKPDRHRTANPSDAKTYQAQLTAALQSLKLWLEDNAELDGGTVFEL